MSAPIKPPTLSPHSTYLHITSPLPPNQIAENAESKNIRIGYIAPVGELKGEYIFELDPPNTNTDTTAQGRDCDQASATQPGQAQEHEHEHEHEHDIERRKEVVRSIKELEGVKGVKIMEQKQRTKR
jgi:hypothetical protein